ncbi:hypothetical protein C8R42DRAFT_647528 [Lentinula raphanica]|nr:hypothetical protein C8R42DRAFT_647528 [Lentinula raphanica]
MQVDRLIHPSIPKCLLPYGRDLSQVLDIGASLLGAIISTALYGAQWPLHVLVVILMICDTLHQIFITQSLYNYLVTNFGNLLHLEQEFEISLFTEYGSVKDSNGFLQLHIFLSLKELIGLKIILILVEFTTVFVYAVQGSIQIKKFAQISVESKSLKLAFIEQIQSSINCITAIAAACATILAPNTLVNLGIFFCIGRLYVNSLLAALNYRTIIHKDEQRLIGSGGVITIET